MKILFLFLISIGSGLAVVRHPIVLVPGDGGSHVSAQYVKSPPHYLCGRQNRWFLLWLNIYFMLPITLGCFVESIKLEYNRTSRHTFSPDFCDIEIPGFGSLDSISYLSNLKLKRTSYFYYVINELVNNLGYEPVKNLRGAPYDFRKGPHEMGDFLNKLRLLIENMYEENNNTSVIAIGHSLGTIYMNLLLQSMTQEWKNKYIKTFMSFSGPYLGAVEAIRTSLSGNNEHIPIISPINVRPAQSSWPSTYLLMPSRNLWPNKTLVMTKSASFTSKTIPDLLALSRLPNAVDHYQNTNYILDTLEAPKTSVYCIYSYNMHTTDFLNYKNTDFPDGQPETTTGDGDGTVNLDSLKHCSSWEKFQTQPVVTHSIPDVGHLDILRDERTLKYLSEVITMMNKQ